ncbi:MAG TPA: sigma-70 family RNA polymerase sigma factor, partial [Bacteroidetes bacterium]|nr:sigma-70 family RNA polymerase sigma factor [Bacteroidota bacterium]
MQKTYTDQEILDGLRRGGQPEDAALRQVYLQNRTAVLDLIKKNKGSMEEAKDVFQEAIMSFYENIKNGKFKGESAISSYIYSIARFIWLNKLKRKGIGQRILDTQQPCEIEESFLPRFFAKEKEKQVLDLFEKLGCDCKKVLVFC